MEKINKMYTPAFAREMLNKIQTGVINEQEAVELRRKLIDRIEQKYTSFRMGYGGGIIQSERQFINHVWNSMNTLKLEYTDLNILRLHVLCHLSCFVNTRECKDSPWSQMFPNITRIRGLLIL